MPHFIFGGRTWNRTKIDRLSADRSAIELYALKLRNSFVAQA